MLLQFVVFLVGHEEFHLDGIFQGFCYLEPLVFHLVIHLFLRLFDYLLQLKKFYFFLLELLYFFQ